jgi:uncharacterized protein HemY
MFEKYLRVKAKWHEVSARKSALEKQVRDEQREYEPLREQAAKAVLLGDEKTVAALTERLKQIEAKSPKKELESLPFSIRILGDELVQVRPTAVQEIREKYLGSYKKTVLNLYGKLREVEKLEHECEAIFNEAQALARKVEAEGPGFPRINYLVSSPPWEPTGQSPLRAFLRDLKNNGLDLGVDLP